MVDSSSFSTIIADPTLTPDSNFIVDLLATDLPPIVNSTNGGVIGYDITIRYNSTILRATDADFKAPLCPAAEGCLFDSSSALPLPREINNTVGLVRIPVVLLGSQVTGSGTLFRIAFQVEATGFTTIDLDEANSTMVGRVDPLTVEVVPYTSEDGQFENRQPFELSAESSTGFILPGQTVSTSITATKVWTVQDFTETIEFANGPVPPDTFVTYDPTQGILPFTTRVTFQTSPTTPNGTYTIRIVATSSVTSARVEINFTLTVGIVDIGIQSASSDKAVVNPGDTVNISITLANKGDVPETFPVDFFADTQQTSLLIGTTTVTNLNPAEMREATLSWDTTSISSGSYSIRATVQALQGEQDASDNNLSAGTVRVNSPPTPKFSFSPSSPEAGNPLSFDASQSSDNDGTIASYTWDFGDGQVGTGSQVSHAYASPGNFTVTLTVVDSDGAVKTMSLKVTVNQAAANLESAPVSPLVFAGLAAVVILTVAAVLFLRGRRKPAGEGVRGSPR